MWQAICSAGNIVIVYILPAKLLLPQIILSFSFQHLIHNSLRYTKRPITVLGFRSLLHKLIFRYFEISV